MDKLYSLVRYIIVEMSDILEYKRTHLSCKYINQKSGRMTIKCFFFNKKVIILPGSLK